MGSYAPARCPGPAGFLSVQLQGHVLTEQTEVLVQGEERKAVLHRLLSNDQIRKAGLGDAVAEGVVG